MPIVKTQNGRHSGEKVIVKVSGWVKIRKNGDTYHFPPSKVSEIVEPDTDIGDSNVIYQNPHGRI
jgi:hypothetical protein